MGGKIYLITITYTPSVLINIVHLETFALTSIFIQTMNNQEAVHLIGHLEDPQEAAECLAKEALTRMSKSNISCIVIRFD
jgi:serine/threonine protein phosphatase PrpC